MCFCAWRRPSRPGCALDLFTKVLEALGKKHGGLAMRKRMYKRQSGISYLVGLAARLEDGAAKLGVWQGSVGALLQLPRALICDGGHCVVGSVGKSHC